jgi:hypothetical protein
MIHLAPMGYVFTTTETGAVVCQGPFQWPNRTFCGIGLLPEKAAKARCVMDLESDDSCRTCVAAMTSRETNGVQALNLGW